MKKIYLILAALVLTLSLAGCGNKPKTEEEIFEDFINELEKSLEE